MKHLLYSNQYGDTISYYCCRIKNAVMVTMRISLPWKHLCRCDTGVTKRVIRQLTTDNCQPTSPRTHQHGRIAQGSCDTRLT